MTFVRTLITATAVFCFIHAPAGAAEATTAPASMTESSTPSPADPVYASLDFANGLYARKMYGPAVNEYEKYIRTFPASPDLASAHFRAGDSYYFLRSYKASIEHFKQFIHRYPKDKRVPTARFRVGTSRFHLKDYRGARAVFSKLSETASDPIIRSGSLYYLAKCYAAQNESATALEIFRALLKSSPQSEYASYAALEVGDHERQAGRSKEALEAYRVAAANPEPPEVAREALFHIAGLFYSQNDFAQAAAVYQRIFDAAAPKASDPVYRAAAEDALTALFQCDAQSKDLTAATSRLENSAAFISGSRAEPEILYICATLQAEKNETAKAFETLERVIAHPKATAELKDKALLRKAELLGEQGKKEEALALFDSLAQGASTRPDRALFEKASLLEKSGDASVALTGYRAVIDRFSDSEFAKEALYRAALLQIKSGTPDAARASFSEFISRYPDNPGVEGAKLQIVQLDLDAKKFDEARQGAEAFLKDYPKSSYADLARYKKGVAEIGLGRAAEAAESFQQAAADAASPLAAEATYGAASALESAGRAPEAILMYEHIRKDFSSHALAKEALARLGYLYVNQGELEKAAELYEDVYLNRPDIPLHSDAALWLIQYSLDRSEFERARKILELLPTRYPGENHRHEQEFYLGESAMGLKEYAKAIELYRSAVSQKADGAFVPHATLGLGLASAALNQPVDAEKYFNQALKFEDEPKISMRARFEIANLRLAQGQFAEAAKTYMMVAILYDDAQTTPLALYRAGECFAKTGQNEDSRRAFEELKTRYPDSEWARKSATEVSAA